MGYFKYILVCLVALQVATKFTSAVISRDDVSSCIKTTKDILLNQQNLTRTRFNETKQRTLNDAQRFQDNKYANLNTAMQKEKSILLTLRESAKKDNYDVSGCGDISNIYQLTRSAYNASAKEIKAEFEAALNRNFTQNLFLVNQFAQSYVRIEMDLQKCGKNDNLCFERVHEECEKVRIQDKMGNLETTFSISSEKIYFTVFTPKIESLYQAKSKDVINQSQKQKNCFTSINRDSSKNDNGGNPIFSIHSLQFLLILPLLFIMLE